MPTNDKSHALENFIINTKPNAENNLFINENPNNDYDLSSKPSYNKTNLNTTSNSNHQFNYKDLRVIGVFINSYIITQYNEALYVIDQHAAHERILYEKYLNSYKNDKISSQNLLIPISINISFDVSVYIHDIIDLLNDYGFNAEPFSQESLVIRAIPNIFNNISSLVILTLYCLMYIGFTFSLSLKSISDKLILLIPLIRDVIYFLYLPALLR